MYKINWYTVFDRYTLLGLIKAMALGTLLGVGSMALFILPVIVGIYVVNLI